MAEQVTEIPGGSGTQTSKFDKYFDGKIWKLTKGTDFTNSAGATAMTIRQVAKRRAGKPIIAVRGNDVYVQILPDDDTPATPIHSESVIDSVQ